MKTETVSHRDYLRPSVVDMTGLYYAGKNNNHKKLFFHEKGPTTLNRHKLNFDSLLRQKADCRNKNFVEIWFYKMQRIAIICDRR